MYIELPINPLTSGYIYHLITSGFLTPKTRAGFCHINHDLIKAFQPLFSSKKGVMLTQMKDQSHISNKNGLLFKNRITIYPVLEGAPEFGDVFIYLRTGNMVQARVTVHLEPVKYVWQKKYPNQLR